MRQSAPDAGYWLRAGRRLVEPVLQIAVHAAVVELEPSTSEHRAWEVQADSWPGLARACPFCEQRWVSGQELLFDARRVTTIGFSEVEQPTTVGGMSL